MHPCTECDKSRGSKSWLGYFRPYYLWKQGTKLLLYTTEWERVAIWGEKERTSKQEPKEAMGPEDTVEHVQQRSQETS